MYKFACLQLQHLSNKQSNNLLCKIKHKRCNLLSQNFKRYFKNQHLNENLKQTKSSKFSYFRLVFVGTLSSLLLYDGVANEFTYCGSSWRFLRSLKTATLIAADYIQLSFHEDAADYETRLSLIHQKCADRLLETCLKNGGLYIKMGQGVAAVNHILPKEYTNTLSLLQDKCLPTTQKDVRRVFQKDFGQLPEEIFVHFDYKPIAAASLAQVFKAQLKTGEPVAVKVQYGDLEKRFPSDMFTIIFLQDIFELFFENYNFGWILRDLHKTLIQEMDFINEGRNSEKCAEHLKKFKFVHVPQVHWDLSKTRVLTMEWADGCKISDLTQIKSKDLNLRDVDLKLFQMFAEQIFNTGFVHADPHPGNIFVRKNKTTGKAELVLLDHGLYEYLPENYRRPLCEFWEATILRDQHKMKSTAEELGVTDHMRFAEVLFQQPIRVQGGAIKTKLSEDEIKHMQKIATQHFDYVMNVLKEMPKCMLFIVRNLNTIRAISRNHGDVVDRPKVMARYAQRCTYTRDNSFMGYIRWLYRRTLFEYHLLRHSFKLNCLNLYFNILYHLGRAPASAKTFLKDMTMQNNIS